MSKPSNIRTYVTHGLNKSEKYGRIAHGYGTVNGTNTTKFMNQNKILNIPTENTVIYKCIMCHYIPQKEETTESESLLEATLLDTLENEPYEHLISLQKHQYGTAPSPRLEDAICVYMSKNST